MDEYRDRCLWFLDPRFVPTDLHEAIRTLDLIERYGDRAAFQRAAELRRWLSQLLAAPRRSRDIDLFHDSETALAATWEADGETLRALGYTLEVIRLAPAFVEALVARGADRSRMQWVRDSAPRFFPLIEDEVLGLALHPFDLATNKVLAMAGRLEPRDWIDVLTSDMKLQPLGFLVWAACGKDPGYNPVSLLGEMSRSHYSEAELDMLDFDGAPPDAAALSTH